LFHNASGFGLKLEVLFQEQVVVPCEDDADPFVGCDFDEVVGLFVGSEWPG
jgi:hypothetical protein